jgi:hypothetical protein
MKIAKNGFTWKRAAFVLIMLLFLLMIPTVASAIPVYVTVKITDFVQVETPDRLRPDWDNNCVSPPLNVDDGDYYARVLIGDEAHGEYWLQSPTNFCNGDNYPWTMTGEVETDDYTNGLIPIYIEIYDKDYDWYQPDDVMDINPDDFSTGLELLYDPASGTWTGDTTSGFSNGDGDTEHIGGETDTDGTQGGLHGAIYFDITHRYFDRFYPTYDEIVDYLRNIAEDNPEIAAAYTIGSSDENPSRDLVALKISDNPDDEEDEPKFLYVGVIHGDEPLGVRVALDLIENLTQAYHTGDPEVTNWVNAYEIWIVPVINPYGYDHIERKNAPNLPGFPLTSGVDLNRNFDFRWDADPPILNPERYDNYSGPAPTSEPETAWLSLFVLTHRPAFGITFHSGRSLTGGGANMDGLIMYPWTPGEHGLPTSLDAPDSDRIQYFANIIAREVQRYRGGTGTTNRPSLMTAGAVGQSTVYSYAKTGMLDYMLETNSGDYWVYDEFYKVDLDKYNAVQQTNLSKAQEYVTDYMEGIKGLQRHFLFTTSPWFTFRGPGVTGHVTDCPSGEPLSATITVSKLDDTNRDKVVNNNDQDLDGDGDIDLVFRTSDPTYGRYMRLVPNGTWTFHFSYPGYQMRNITLDVLELDYRGLLLVPLVDLDVAMDSGDDTDSDGLTNCQEVTIYGTNPDDPDSDHDGLNDGDEISYNTDPWNSDSDNDGLGDGYEVHNHNTDPMNDDSDGDDLLDGEDVEFIQYVVHDLPASAFRNEKTLKGQRTAINSMLDDAESLLATGQNSEAIKLLRNLRKHVDGDPNPDKDDWIIDNAGRMEVRALIDILIANLPAI